MTICDSVFFASSPSDLLKRFPGWLPPMPEERVENTTNPFTKKPLLLTTRAPIVTTGYDAKRWKKHMDRVYAKAPRDPEGDEYAALGWPHFTTYNIYPARLEPLGKALGIDVRDAFEMAMYPPPECTIESVWEFPDGLTATLAKADGATLEAAAKRYGEDERVSERVALPMVQSLAGIARGAGPGHKMYLYNLGPG